MKKLLICLCASLLLAGCGKKKAEGELKITFYNAGEADTILFETEKGVVLMDTATEEYADTLVNDLKGKGISAIDTLIITNFGADHIGGADHILENFKVDHVYVTYETKKSEQITQFENALRKSGKIADVLSNRTFTLAGASFEIIGPDREYSRYENLNSSLITKVTFGTNTFLFMGDAHDQRTVDFMQNNDVKADLIKVAYHGNPLPSYSEFFKEVEASKAVISNHKKHPTTKEVKKTKALLEEAGTEVYETKNGSVEVVATAETFAVTQQ